MAVDICGPDALCRHRQHICCGGQLRATGAAAQPVKTLQQLQQQPQPVGRAAAHQQQLARGGLQRAQTHTVTRLRTAAWPQESCAACVATARCCNCDYMAGLQDRHAGRAGWAAPSSGAAAAAHLQWEVVADPVGQLQGTALERCRLRCAHASRSMGTAAVRQTPTKRCVLGSAAMHRPAQTSGACMCVVQQCRRLLWTPGLIPAA